MNERDQYKFDLTRRFLKDIGAELAKHLAEGGASEGQLVAFKGLWAWQSKTLLQITEVFLHQVTEDHAAAV